MITLFLKENDIPSLTAFDGNIDADKLKPHILTAQTNDVKRILGTELYEKMLTDYEAGPGVGDLAGIYLTIYNNYLVPMEVYFSCMYYMTFGASKTSNNGIYTPSFDGGNPTSDKNINVQIGTYRQLANNTEQFFYDFMEDNEVPEYNRTKTDESNNNPVIPWY